ncbi:hypothetical protein GALL_509210 [mine drainage metagenome]|uniref:Outer membrane protein beta-barrel domain-containing protein n=1 Tax=mine drainage metagenome TaxID=410659 RepID=A0A1J5P8G0_9ZZZZ
MKIIVAAASAALLLAAAPAAFAAAPDSQVYGTVGYADSEGLGVVQARLGYRFATYFGVEAEAGVGVKEDTVHMSGVSVKLKEQSQAAAYGVAFLPVSPKVDLFARVGYGTVRAKASVPGFSASDNGDDWAYGVGAQFFFDDHNGLRADYTKFSTGDYSNTWSVAYVRKF